MGKLPAQFIAPHQKLQEFPSGAGVKHLKFISMKHYFLLCATFITTIFSVHAQGFSNFGTIKAGVNFANISNSDYSSKYQTGFNVGGTYSFSISQQNPLFFQTGIGFEMKGAKNSYSIDGERFANTIKSYVAELPVLLSYQVNLTERSKIYPFFGVFYSFAVAGKIEGGDNDSLDPYKKSKMSATSDEDPFESRMFHRSDFGIKVGIDYRYRKYSLGVAYDAGLANMYAKKFRDRHFDASSGTFSVNVGYYFE